MTNIKRNDLIQEVDVENIYTHILALEGPRYPLDNLDALNAAADYIRQELKNCGFRTEYQEFQVDGLDTNFKNVLGYCGDNNTPAVVLGAHYDTVPDCPGANDNLSAVAILLEFARVISKLETPPTIILGFFTLEEGHPGFEAQLRQLKQKFAIVDSKGRFKSWEMFKLHRELNKLFRKSIMSGKNASEGYQDFLAQHKEELSEQNKSYFEEWNALISKYPASSFFEEMGLIGSHYFVSQLDNPAQSIKYLINYDTVGWIYDSPKTQKPLPIPEEFTETYKVDLEKEIGNFITIIGDVNSGSLLKSFTENCQNNEVDIPYYKIDLPIEYEAIKASAPDTLRMDHAPFWRKRIPAITMADGAEFRSNLYHTPADLAKYMDFDMLSKIVKATLLTVLDN